MKGSRCLALEGIFMQETLHEVMVLIENWVRLKQYIDFLPFQYTYSVERDCVAGESGAVSRISIYVGNQHWVGNLCESSRCPSLSEALQRLK